MTAKITNAPARVAAEGGRKDGEEVLRRAVRGQRVIEGVR